MHCLYILVAVFTLNFNCVDKIHILLGSYSQWEFVVWLRKLKQRLYINLEVWDGKEDGREFLKGGDICISMANFMLA